MLQEGQNGDCMMTTPKGVDGVKSQRQNMGVLFRACVDDDFEDEV